MVTVVKPNGTLCICVDPHDLNNAINCDNYPTHTIEDVVTRIPKATIYSVFDTSSGFWQIKLDEQSVHLQHTIWAIHAQEAPVGVIIFSRYVSKSDITDVRGY